MRRLVLSIIVAFTVCVTAAVAQSGSMGGSTQGRQGSPPTAQPGQTQPGQTQPGYPGGPDMGSSQTDQNGPSAGTEANKGEKKLKGCVQSQAGQYVLETKHGKSVALAGQDVSAHVGHEVAVKGTWESGNASGMSSTSTSGASNAGEKRFNVTNVEMISDTCKGSKKTSTGTGAGPTGSSTGSGSNSGAGSTGTTPPQ